jgi:hypothetical protein
MSKYICIYFEEPVQDHFPGFRKTMKVREFPLWCDYSVAILQNLAPPDPIPAVSLSISGPDDMAPLYERLERGRGTDTLIIGRTGNIVVFDWRELRALGHLDGIAKVHIGRVPSELYVLRKERFTPILSEIEERMTGGRRNFCTLLFDDYLFHHFNRVIDIEGYSYLIRNTFEYFRENMSLVSHFRDEGFLDLYARLDSPFSARTSISENGTVRNSMLGAGSRVRGLVEDSILFHDVFVARDAEVRGSVVLPSSRIEEGAVVENALIIGGRDCALERNAQVGGTADVVNREFPAILKKGLTVIGSGLSVPRNSQIGAGCLVENRSEKRLSSPLNMESGSSFRAE